MPASDWRPSIEAVCGGLWPDYPGLPSWIEGQVHAESRGNPIAESPAGARGLLQLMPETAAELGVTDPDDPEQNLRGGVTYLKRIFTGLRAQLAPQDRLLWSFAGYNCGPEFVRLAVMKAEQERGLGAVRWETERVYLFHHACGIHTTTGVTLYPDHVSVWVYVATIEAYAQRVRHA